MMLFFVLFFCFQTLILYCCIAAGNTPDSRMREDEEQMAFIKEWNRKHVL